MATASEEPPGIQDASGNRKNVPSEGQSIGMSQAMKKTIGHRGIDPTGETTYKKNQLRQMAELKNVTLSAKYYVVGPHWSPDSETPTARGVYRCLSAAFSFCQTRSSALKGAIQLGITHTVGSLSQKPERDVLLQDFEVVESIFFPNEGSNLTPAHHYGDFRFKTYAPVAFRYFRELFGIRPDDYMYSLCNESLIELSSSGASGSLFYLSSDDEFIIKTVQHKEAEFLQKLLPGYFMNLNQNRRTLLPKFYGLYCVQAAGKNIRIVVMNNLLPSPVQMHQKFDLKGSTYKRRASPKEKEKAVPTYKDLDFIQDMQEGILLEGDKYSAVCKTIQRDCLLLQSFKIMDYSLLVGIHNVDQACRAQASEEAEATRRPQVQKSLFSTAIEAIQAESGGVGSMDPEDQTGGIPARNAKGERLLVYMGIIDILQSYRFVKKLEHSWKALVHDGDTVSVHRPSFYADRFQKFMCSTVFRKMLTKTSPTKKRRANGLLRKTPSSGLTQTDTSNQMFPLQHLFSSDTVEVAEVNKVMQSGRPDILPLMPSPCNTEDDTPGSSASSSQVNSGFTPATHPPSSPEEASVGVGGNQATLRELEQSTPERAQSPLDESISAKDLP